MRSELLYSTAQAYNEGTTEFVELYEGAFLQMFGRGEGTVVWGDRRGLIEWGRGLLEERAKKIRSATAGTEPDGFSADPEFDLRTRSGLGRDYEASTVLSKFYALGSVPDDETLAQDVSEIVRVYQDYLGSATTAETGVWLFQGNPKIFDLRGACAALPELRFDVRQYHKQVSPGDRVYLWESGSAGGVVGVGQVLSEPDHLPFAPGEEPFIRDASKLSSDVLAVRLRTETVVDPVVPRDVVRAELGLEDLRVLKFPQATNYPVTKEQDAILKRLVQSVAPLRVEGDMKGVVSAFSGALHEAGLHFGVQHDGLVRSFLAALATKRFAILTGLSGSGKTQLGLALGRWFGETRYRVVPVRPDWTGPEALLGYPDALQEVKDGRRAWHAPAALEFILQATADPAHPYLLLLDEMNLAHVERYFADVLSGMESKEPCVPNVRRGDDGLWREVEKTASWLEFPRNLFLIGTVNVDETTYMFSPKVLDRANTFEFRVESTDLDIAGRSPDYCTAGHEPLVRYFLRVSGDDQFQDAHPASGRDEIAGQLRKAHEVLSASGFEFGHRVFYEALRFAAYLEAAGQDGPLAALDRIVIQKLLPKIHGSYRRLHGLLGELGRYTYQLSDGGENAPTFDPLDHEAKDAKLPVSFAKIQRMTGTLRANQFVSFTE